MRRTTELTGTFGQLTIIRRLPPNGVETIYLCKCNCGSMICKGEIPVRACHLKSGNSTSCGVIKNYRRLRPYESLYNRISHYKGVTLTFPEFLEFTKIEECFYCAEPIDWARFESNGRYNLDRKDNSLGYSKENCVVCCKDCNYAKGNRYSFEEWVVMTRALRQFRNS
jgi:hypothetical protein